MSAVIQQETVVAARDGDHAALCQLVDASMPAVQRFARRHCPAIEVEDAVQDSLFEITRRIRGRRAAPACVAWIFRIVKNTCDRAIRSMRRSEPVEELPARHRDPGDPYALTMDLIAALESLPAHHREVVLMRDFQELTIEEMAVQLGISRQATKSRLHRARLLVREYLHA